MDRATRKLCKLETFYNKDPMQYLDETNDFLDRDLNKDFEASDVGNMVFKSVFFLQSKVTIWSQSHLERRGIKRNRLFGSYGKIPFKKRSET